MWILSMLTGAERTSQSWHWHQKVGKEQERRTTQNESIEMTTRNKEDSPFCLMALSTFESESDIMSIQFNDFPLLMRCGRLRSLAVQTTSPAYTTTTQNNTTDLPIALQTTHNDCIGINNICVPAGDCTDSKIAWKCCPSSSNCIKKDFGHAVV